MELTHTNRVVSYFNEPSSSESDDPLIITLKKFWEVESFGIEEKDIWTDETFLCNLEFKGECYEVGLPWIRYCHDLPITINHV